MIHPNYAETFDDYMKVIGPIWGGLKKLTESLYEFNEKIVEDKADKAAEKGEK